MMSNLDIEFAENFDGLSGVKHGFFTRLGGVSTGKYSSLNTGLGSDDGHTAVLENRHRVAASFGTSPNRLLSLHQVHSPDVVIATKPWEKSPEADGIVTQTPGLMISAMSADCSPVLFYDPKAHIIGSAHAGWRGAIGGVCEATLKAMAGLGAAYENIHAAIGPCLGQDNFEVGPEFVAQFLAESERHQSLFTKGKEDRSHFDIKTYLTRKLDALGLESVWAHPHCTYRQNERYFSYRYNCHKGISDYGRNISAIMLES